MKESVQRAFSYLLRVPLALLKDSVKNRKARFTKGLPRRRCGWLAIHAFRRGACALA
jgi:hypothetical protein